MNKNWWFSLAVCVAAVLLAGCTVNAEKGKQRYLQSGLRLMEQERYAEAAIQFRNALKLDPSFVEALCQLSQAELASRQWAGAYTALQRAIELDPKRMDARLSLGALLLGAREYKRAEEQADYVLEHDPKNPRGHELRALTFAVLSENELARDSFLKVIELQPRNPSGYVSLALINITLRRYSEAEQALLKAIEIDPRFESSYINLASLYRVMRQLPKAEAVMQDALRTNPDSVALHMSLAELLFAEGKTAEAEALFTKLLVRQPRSARVAMAIGDFHSQRGDRARAAEAYRAGIRADGKNPELKQRLVDWYISGGQLQEAQELNAEILRDRPKDLAAGIARGRILLAQKKVGEAITELRNEVREPADSWQRHYFLAAAYRQNRMPGEAKEQLQLALRLSAENILVRHSLTELCLETGELPLARETAERTVQLQPANAVSRILLGTVLLRQRNLSGAREQLATAVRLAADEPRAHLSLGLVDAAEGKYPDAEREFEAALQASPGFSPALTALTEMLVQRNQGEKALTRVRGYLAANPGNASAHVLMGSLQARAKRYTAAKEELTRAMELDPNLWQANMRLAEVHQALGETDAAIAQYERVLASQPRSAVVHGIVASLYYSHRNPAAARKHYEQALAIDSGLGSVANNLAWLYVNEGGNLDAALSLAQKAKQQLPDSPATSDTLAWVLYKKGFHAAAIPILQECVAKVPTSPIYPYHLGMALLASGRKQDAKTYLETALRLKLAGEDDQAARAALARIQ